MSWFKVDDAFFMHPKVVAAGNQAIGLWLRCGTYSAHHLTDGFIPREVALTCGTVAQASRLVDVGMWDTAAGGWRMHDFHDYQPTADEVREMRRKRAEAGSKGGSKKRAKPEANALANGKQNLTPVPYPSDLPTVVTDQNQDCA